MLVEELRDPRAHQAEASAYARAQAIAQAYAKTQAAAKAVAQAAAQAVESCPVPIEELVREGRVTELPGVGKSIAEKIEEIVKTGKLRYHEELKKKLPVDLHSLTQVEGVGPRIAKLLYEHLGVRNLDDLERAAKEHRIRTI
ncbi:hypothetical protein J7L84_01375, partial [Candidatus Bipolaricaulota bacterium]|nr:hypothetical protein [Candidatus Bipolaricaulota bacterium]